MNRNTTNYGSITDPEVRFQGGSRNNEFSAEFNGLCDDIATNLYTINSSIKNLLENLRCIGTPKDNIGIRNKIHLTQLSTNQIASATTREIGKLRHKTPRNDKQRLLQVEKIEEEFKDTITKYHNIQKELAEKQKANLLITSQADNPPSDDEETEDQQKQVQMTREMQFQQEMMLEREERVKQIEADVLDINEIMRELGSLVHDQAGTIDTIENSIDHAAGNVEEGNEQLMKASRHQTQYRKKLLILVIIAAVIAIILISVLVSELKK